MSDRLAAQVGYTGEGRSDSADYSVTAGMRLVFQPPGGDGCSAHLRNRVRGVQRTHVKVSLGEPRDCRRFIADPHALVLNHRMRNVSGGRET